MCISPSISSEFTAVYISIIFCILGRYVSIQKYQNDSVCIGGGISSVLTLCEVEVSGLVVTYQVVMTPSDVVCAVTCTTNSACLGYRISRPIGDEIVQCDLMSVSSALVSGKTVGIFVEKYFEYIDNVGTWNMKGSIFHDTVNM